MDRNTENFTMNLLNRVKPNCAIFFISHRFNALKNNADIIFILENKTISKLGTHEDLMKSDNFYSDFWKN
jgi:ATP-binding cassette, subfamily C, bacteriocin exporter